jgi:glutamyl-tRNA synthetase
MRTYLARLGWSHGDDELFTTEQAVEWFDLSGIGKSPARFDFKKLDHVSGWHIARTPDEELAAALVDYCAAAERPPLTGPQVSALTGAMFCLKDRAKTLPDLLEKAHFVLTSRPVVPDERAAAALDAVSRGILGELTPQLQSASWSREDLEAAVGAFAESRDLKLGKVAQPMRAALAGRMVSPSVFDMMLVLGRDESLARLADASG